MNVTWEIDDPALAERLERDRLTSRQSVFLDMGPDKKLETGKNKNIGLGRLREAVGQNTPGQPWAPSMLEGAAGRITVEHVLRDGVPYDQVARVTSMNG